MITRFESKFFLIKKPLSRFSILHFAKSKTKRVTRRRIEKHLFRALSLLASLSRYQNAGITRFSDWGETRARRRVAAALNGALRRRFDRTANEELSTRYPEISRIASEPEPPDYLLVIIHIAIVAGSVAVRERRLKYLRTYSYEMTRAVTFQTYAREVITWESPDGHQDGGEGRRRHARLCRSRCLHRFATATRGRRRGVNSLLRSRATEFHRLCAGRAGDCRATHNKAARGNYGVGTFTVKRARLLRG